MISKEIIYKWIFKSLLFLICLFNIQKSFSQDQLNVTLFSNVKTDDARYSGSWGYIDGQGREYGLIGAFSGTVMYRIDTPVPDSVGFIPGPKSKWREIAVLGDYAYVTTEGTDSIPTGMQVIYLGDAPNTISLVKNFNETFTKGHIVQRDIFSDAPYIYVMGTGTTEGVHIIDVSNPEDPKEVGLYDPDYYIHDAHIRGEYMYCAAFNEGQLDILNISNPTEPTLVAVLEDPGLNTHSSWVTDDERYLVLADEIDGQPARIFNIEDRDAIFQVAEYSANLESLFHNPYIRGNYLYASYNTEGLRVVDLVDPEVPVEVGYYDTFAGPSGGFNGLWSAWPFFPSGKIIGADRTKGLFVWTFDEVLAGRIYGKVVDASTNSPIVNAEIKENNSNQTKLTNFNGDFGIGFLPETYSFTISAEGYTSRDTTITLIEGDVKDVIFKLDLQSSSTIAQHEDNAMLYPNPANDFILAKNLSVTHFSHYKIINVLGQTVMRNRAENLASGISIAKLDTGFYRLLLENDKGESIKEFSFVKE